MTEEAHQQWQGRTDGNRWMQRSLIAGFKIIPLRVYYAIVAVVVVFYMIFNHSAYLATYRFFRKRMGYGKLKSFIHVYRNQYNFGKVVIDRFACYADIRFKIVVDGQHIIDRLTTAKEGFLQLGAHVGNIEIAGYMTTSKDKHLNVLAYAGETQTVMENRKKIFSHRGVTVVPVAAALSHIFILNDALSRREVVGISADRMFGSSKAQRCSFFGEEVRFPTGLFLMAVQREVAAVSFFVMKQDVHTYKVYVRILEVDRNASKREQLQQLAQSFASNLEDIVRLYPTQWYNYYDFWNQ